MLSKEFLVEAFILKGVIGNGMTYGVSPHVSTQAALPDRNVKWNDILRIINRLKNFKPELKQMIHFPQFYVRDDVQGIELGCKFTSFGAPEVQLAYINTVVRADHIRKSDTPTIVVIQKHK
jgi:hypothetical protein